MDNRSQKPFFVFKQEWYNKPMFNNHRNSNKAFTLIELLVVVAIIGILASVVIASLNSAREKGKIGAIKSTLKNMQSQAEITYTDTGSYASTYDGSYNCIGPLANMAQSLIDKGVTVKCYSRNDPSRSDVYLRFGATAIIYDANDFKAWSTDQNGVVAWDQKGVNASGAYVDTDVYSGMTFAFSNTACATAGGRLPSLEQLFTLGRAYGAASLIATGTTTYKPTSTGFVAASYWSSTPVPSDGSLAYDVPFGSGGIYSHPTANGYYVRCVR
jgi:prepilin-type N-terminal cleavage/methylation domain-containing protein